MSEVRLVICDAQRAIYGNHHVTFADAAVAALSDEPQTIADLDAAMERFMARADPPRSFFELFRPFMAGADDQPYDAGIVIIDLPARLLVHTSTYSSPQREGYLPWHDGKAATEIEARYHLSEDWEFSRDVEGWERLAAARRAQRLANPPLEARAVLYGLPLVEFIAQECLVNFRRPAGWTPPAPLAPPAPAPAATPGDDDAHAGGPDKLHQPDPEMLADVDAVRQVHIRWLMTARPDLHGQTPREVCVARHRHVSWNMDDRQGLWSQTHRCPRGLDRASAAYRYGGLGTHELVVYYDMVRSLVWAGRHAVRELPPAAAGPDGAANRAATSDLAERLATLREQWLDGPDAEFGGRTPRSIIDNERRRVPEAMSGHEAMVDHDCPLCQMMADHPGPAFWGLDGSGLDDDFAFQFRHRTIEEWQEEQRSYEEFNRRFNAEQAELERLGVEHPGGGYTDPDYAWERSFSKAMAPGQPAVVRLFTVGSHLAKLIVRLKEPPEERGLIDRLNRDYGNLRAVAQATPKAPPEAESDTAASADAEADAGSALLGPVIERFCATLDEVAATREELEPECTELAERLRKFGDPADQEVDPPSEGTDEDEDIPY